MANDINKEIRFLDKLRDEAIDLYGDHMMADLFIRQRMFNTERERRDALLEAMHDASDTYFTISSDMSYAIKQLPAHKKLHTYNVLEFCQYRLAHIHLCELIVSIQGV